MDGIGDEYYDAPYGSTSKRKVKSRHVDFVGWGSKPLIEFLQSLGLDTTKQISRHDVYDIVNRYVTQNKLVQLVRKKKKVVCDEVLQSVFGKKCFVRGKIFNLLEAHYAENNGDRDSESLGGSDEENGGSQQKGSDQKKASGLNFKIPEKPRSCFASIVPENLRLVYLKKSLVEDLLKDNENFEAKVVGCFVRIKSDRYDYSQKNPYMLVQVKGLKKSSGADTISKNVLLEVSNFIKDVSIPMLSDDDFKQEECEDLKQRVKSGLLKRPIVVEWQEKAQVLHEDITKHWLPREIAMLQRLIDRFNEKGMRRELAEHLDKKQLLQTPAEQERLLHEVPQLIADELEPEVVPQDLPNVQNGNDGFVVSTVAPVPEIPSRNAAENQVPTAKVLPKVNSFASSPESGKKMKPLKDQYINAGNTQLSNVHDEKVKVENHAQLSTVHDKKVNVENEKVSLPENKSVKQVIELRDDEDELQVDALDPVALMWYYVDPSGTTRGPFSLLSLRHWQEDDFFPDEFVVWKTGQSFKDAVLLTDLLARLIPSR